mmetsp:Transcript_44103/g.143479  ORF Transcript_44103/g.143479 Transcript_44103/m.143479 type:complete len:203 (-) Transcript_44103:420-1028(-)
MRIVRQPHPRRRPRPGAPNLAPDSKALEIHSTYRAGVPIRARERSSRRHIGPKQQNHARARKPPREARLYPAGRCDVAESLRPSATPRQLVASMSPPSCALVTRRSSEFQWWRSSSSMRSPCCSAANLVSSSCGGKALRMRSAIAMHSTVSAQQPQKLTSWWPCRHAPSCSCCEMGGRSELNSSSMLTARASSAGGEGGRRE